MKRTRTAQPPDAIILGGGDCSIGIIRAFAAAGLAPALLHYGTFNPGRHSRFLCGSFEAPIPSEQPEKFLELILNLPASWDGTLLIPADDIAVAFLARQRSQVLKRFVSSVPEWSIVKQLLEKRFLYRLAGKAGVPVPQTHYPESMDEIAHAAAKIGFPCLLKPSSSYAFSLIFRKKLLRVANEQELRRAYAAATSHGLKVFVSEYIPGDDSSLFHYRSYRNEHGAVLAEMCTQKLRQYPPEFGVAAFSKTVPMEPRIKEWSRRLLDHSGYCGISSIEFKRDKRDDSFRLMEANVRNVLPERLFTEAGINFPQITYTDLVEGQMPDRPEYRLGLYWVQNLLDLKALLHERNLSLREYLTPFRKGAIKCIPFFDDPGPFIARCWLYARSAVSSDFGFSGKKPEKWQSTQ